MKNAIMYIFGWLTIDRKRLANFRKAIRTYSVEDLKDIADAYRADYNKSNSAWMLAYAKAAEKILANG